MSGTILRKIGAFFFNRRDLLPVPLILGLLKFAVPNRKSWLRGLPFVALGEGLRIWGIMHIGPTTRTRSICADRLVTSGPYSWSRHPLYLANILKIVGLLIIAGNFRYALAVSVFYALEFSTMIPYEESFLAERFEKEFTDYARQVPVLLPSGRRFSGANPSAYSLAESLRSEKRTFASTGLILALIAIIGFLGKDIEA